MKWSKRRYFSTACGIVMAGIALLIWYRVGLNLWTLILGAVLFACPLVALVISLRESRRLNRTIRTAVEDELRRSHR